MTLNTPEFFDLSEIKEFDDYLNTEIEDYFIYVDNDLILGSGGINYFPDKQTARISWDMVHPDYHGKGIGKMLLEYRLSVIRQKQNISKIEVRTSQLANNFYQKMGFTLERVEKDFWAEGYDLYYMLMDS